jgi:protoheme IX farnesyltransferase
MKSAAIEATLRPESLFSDICALVKARLSLLVLATTLVGFLLGSDGAVNYLLLAATLVGTALSACGASALNQWWEREHDGRMKRTRNRPLPAGRMHPSDALLFGIFFSLSGLAVLGLFAHPRAALLAFITIAIYVFVYTPMKRVSAMNTLVGAIPGALPPLIGWVAARGHYALEGGVLFAILWLWQMPHFLAIAWMYRDEYANAGFIMLAGDDPDGATTSRQALLYSLSLLVVSLVPGVIRMNSPFYFFGALLLGLAFASFAVRFVITRSRGAARALFLASIIYLPLLLGLLVATRTR